MGCVSEKIVGIRKDEVPQDQYNRYLYCDQCGVCNPQKILTKTGCVRTVATIVFVISIFTGPLIWFGAMAMIFGWLLIKEDIKYCCNHCGYVFSVDFDSNPLEYTLEDVREAGACEMYEGGSVNFPPFPKIFFG